MTEMAYFRVYLAWEVFLEETFVLYLMGRQAPRGRKVHRYSLPPSFKAARQWVIPESRQYATWASMTVVNRAQRFFRNGHPFAKALRSNQEALDDARTIRNALAHEGSSARDKFEKLVRQELLTLPPGTSVGGFLATTRPKSSPPGSFLEFYVEKLEAIAGDIVPV